MTTSTELLIATGNEHKAEEIGKILRGILSRPIKLLTTRDLDEPTDVEETGTTFLENALIKAHHYARISARLSLADDSGLVIDALDGRPGIYSARFAPTPAEQIQRVLKEMEGVEAAKRSARFICVAALADPSGDVSWREERIEGWIATHEHGEGGFGYDPIFVPSVEIEGAPDSEAILDGARTLAELSPEEKNAISHRGQAVEAIAEELAAKLA